MSTAWLQSKLRDVAYQERITTGDPANLTDRIDILRQIEICYWRGLIDYQQIRGIEHLISEVDSTYIDMYICPAEKLAAALRVLAEYTQYTDETYLQLHSELVDSSTEFKLSELSNDFTQSLIKKDIEDHECLAC